MALQITIFACEYNHSVFIICNRIAMNKRYAIKIMKMFIFTSTIIPEISLFVRYYLKNDIILTARIIPNGCIPGNFSPQLMEGFGLTGKGIPQSSHLLHVPTGWEFWETRRYANMLGLYSLKRCCLIGMGIPIINLRWSSCAKMLGLYSLKMHCLMGMGIPIINLRQSEDCCRFIMSIPIPIRQCLSD